MTVAAWLLAGYLLGAVPASYLAGRLRGIDLREHGSRNLGATNVYRVLGWRYAVPVALFDIGKGVAAVLGLGAWARDAGVAAGLAGDWVPVTLGLAAVAGHMYSPFVGFRGGKGVATATGVFVALAPLAVLVGLVVWAGCLWLTGFVSLSSLVAVVTFPVWVAVTAPGARPVLCASVALAPLIVYTHRGNIRRLLAGTEHRFRGRGPG